MTEPRTVIVLDSHPGAFSPTVSLPIPNVAPTQLLPPFPLWASMVEGTLGFCRIAWGLARPHQAPVLVVAAKQTPFIFNSWKDSDQNLVKIAASFEKAQPREQVTGQRMANTVQQVMQDLSSNKGSRLPRWRRFRMVLVVLWKKADETGTLDNEEEAFVDLRSLVFQAFQTLSSEMQSNIKHLQVDVLRVLPFNSNVPPDTCHSKVSSQITMSVYNIPNGQDDFYYAMIHLAQQYYNVNRLVISKIPMKTKADLAHPGQPATTKTVSFYYQAGCQHRFDPIVPTTELRLYHHHFLEGRTTELVYLKRGKRSDTGWCTCMHVVSPVKSQDPPTETFLDMTLKGSASYLVTVKAHSVNKKDWTHVLVEHQGEVYLRCLDRNMEAAFIRAETGTNKAIVKQEEEVFIKQEEEEEEEEESMIKQEEGVFVKQEELHVKQESKPTPLWMTPSSASLQEFMDNFVRPIVFDSREAYLKTVTVSTDRCAMVPYNPFRFTHKNSIPVLLSPLAFKTQKVYTNQYIERAARWRTCMRDCNGTDRFPVEVDSRSIMACSIDALNGDPISTGFGVASGLVNDLFEQLETIMVQSHIRDQRSAEGLIDMLVDELTMALQGRPRNVFPKSLRGKEVHRILTTISQKTTENETAKEPAKEVNSSESDVDMAWRQTQHYQGMSHREREDAISFDGMDSQFKERDGFHPKQTRNPTPLGVNPLFRGRRKGKDIVEEKSKYMGTSAMYSSYLDIAPPTYEEKAVEETQEDKQLGTPQSVHWAYWKTRQIRKRGFREENDPYDGTELVYKQGVWRRAKKEFDGRMPVQGGEQGELI
ncbi:hypothetical protein BDF14DRAFT_1883888 [Spinellus fusiger]|nr:hypothetical protein BDF14DRAFT_1883888 [Spinellus fusiger]